MGMRITEKQWIEDEKRRLKDDPSDSLRHFHGFRVAVRLIDPEEELAFFLYECDISHSIFPNGTYIKVFSDEI